MVPAGKLTELVTVQQYSGQQDVETLEPQHDEGSWTTEAENIFAEVETLSGRDFVQINQAGYTASHRVKIRYRAGVQVKRTRFIHNGIPLYVIHPVNVQNKNALLEILCQSGEPNL